MRINPGIVLMLLVALFQSTMQAVVKCVSADINTTTQLFSYYFIPLLLFIPLIAKQGIIHYKTKKFGFLLLRGVITTASVFCFFYTAKHSDLGVGAILFNTTPVFIPIIASIFLKEYTAPKTYLGIFVSLIGIIIVIHPKAGAFFSLMTFIGLASGFLMALSQVMLRYLAKLGESVNNIVFYLYLTCTLSTLIFILTESLFNSHQSIFNLPNNTNNSAQLVYGMLLLLGVLSFVAQRVLTKAFKYMPASKLAPYLYVSVPVSSLYGWLFWHQNISYSVLIGSVFVVLGVCIITFESKLQRVNKVSQAVN